MLQRSFSEDGIVASNVFLWLWMCLSVNSINLEPLEV